MKRILTMLLVFCAVFGLMMPLTAFAAEPTSPLGCSESGTNTDLSEAGIAPLSGFEGGGAEYFTRIRLTAADRDGNPIAGAVYGIYRMADETLAETLTTDYNGVAVSGELSVEWDYYLREISAPEGFLPNEEREEFWFGESCVASRIDVNVVYDPIVGSIQIIKVDGDGNPLEGAGFYIYRQSPWSLVETLTTDADGMAFTGELPYGWYEIYEYAVPEGFTSSGWDSVFVSGDAEAEIITVVNHRIPITGSVTVVKVDAANMSQKSIDSSSPLVGTVFGLYGESGKKIAELTIGSDGKASYDGLTKGRYFLKELTPAEGFLLTDMIFPFAIEVLDENVEIIVPNERGLGTVKVLKTGENGAPLADVAFDIYRSATDKKVGELRTDADGSAQAEIPLGRYYLVETATAEGYLLPEENVAFALIRNGATVEVAVRNEKAPTPQPQDGRIRLIKKSEDGKLLPGAVFGVYRTDTGEKVGELATGSDGTAVSAALPALEQGYYLLEHTAPAGYVLSNEKTTALVKEGETTEITLVNKAVEKPAPPEPESKLGKLLIIKKAEKTGTLLKGAVFDVYRTSDDKRIGEITTDRFGEAALELEADEYYLRELEAPAGFKLDSGRIAFRIKSEETKEITVTNKQEASTAGSLLVVKKSEDGRPLSGAVFGIYDAATREKLDEITTDRYGEAVLELEAGGYFLRELKAPAGYALSADKVDFKIKTGETKEITLSNKLLEPETPETPATGTVKLMKKAAGSGQPLPGAVFEVFTLADNKKAGEIISGADGTAVLSLPAGDYYLLEKTAPAGFKLESARILFRIKAGAVVKVEVTNMKEDGSQPVQPSKPNPPTGTPDISIPKTGEAFPTLDYMLAGLLFALAGACGIALWRGRRKGQRRA